MIATSHRAAMAAAAFALLASVAPDRTSAQEPSETARFGAWTVYRLAARSETVCFALSRPVSRSPGATTQDEAGFFLSAWPRKGVKTEPSVRAGTAFRKGATVTVAIKGESFILYAEGDRAYVDDPTAELKLIDAMKKGRTMVIVGELEGGVRVSDTYSLTGVSQAVGAVAQDCK